LSSALYLGTAVRSIVILRSGNRACCHSGYASSC